MNKKFTNTATGFVHEAKRLCATLHPADIVTAREIAEVVAQVSEACGELRANMPILIETPRFDWSRLNIDVLTHIFKFAGAAARKRLATMCRLFQRIYYNTFVGRITIPENLGSNCPNLAPLDNMDVIIASNYEGSEFGLQRLHCFFKWRCRQIPKNVAEGKHFHTNGFLIRKLLVPSITLQPEIALPLNTTYLSVVGRVYGVKKLTLFVLYQQATYTLFPPFDGLEILNIEIARGHELYGEYFHIFYRNLCDIINSTRPLVKKIYFPPVLMQKFKTEQDKYPLPLNVHFDD